jgi:hypothetical protein
MICYNGPGSISTAKKVMIGKTTWLAFRILRWAAWLAVVGYYAHFAMTRPAHLNAFGHLLLSTEFWMFILPLVAVFVGFMEVMMRGRAGLPSPALGRDWHVRG